MILLSTAERTGGVCMACKQGIRQDIERAKNFYEVQKKYDPYRELWKSLVHRVYKTDEGFGGLTSDEKVYFSVCVLDGEVYNGGIEQFFTNSSGALYNEAVSGLRLLEATHTLDLLFRAKKILFGDNDPSENREERWDAIRKYSEDNSEPPPDWAIALEEVEKAYVEDPDKLGVRLTHFAEEKGLVAPFMK